MNLSFPQMPEKLTSTEQDIVEYIAAHRDEFLCMTIGQLSAALHISEATVSRFARHVGCEDFKHLKRTVVEQTVQRGPVQKLSNTLQAKEGDILAAWLEQQCYNLQKTLDLLDREAFAAAVAALLVAVVALSLKGREAVPAQGSPAESGMSYYTPKASASQGSAAQPAGDEDGPYRVAVYDGKIGVFRQGETEPFLTADVEVYLLPQEDIALLRAGLEADTLAEVKAILEDYQ